MGFAVVHLEKAKGTDSGMSAHIERTIDPKNADKERTHLNRELITFPDRVENRTQAIQHRLDTAGLLQCSKTAESPYHDSFSLWNKFYLLAVSPH